MGYPSERKEAILKKMLPPNNKTIKELAQRWYPKQYSGRPTKKGSHRAMDDLLESIEELKYYREALFLPRES